MNKENIDFCKKRFKDLDRLEYFICSGYNLQEIKDDKFTFIFSFDSMVHFDVIVIISYLFEFYRVLKKDGYVLLHHSNCSCNLGGDFRHSPHWRNFMTRELFKHISIKCGFEVVEQKIIDWGEIKDLDCITLLKK
ncbi:MAG: hypothetical protein PWR24_764 [Desulfonauticus sp.]|nr:hypothetical protein [Desulfonauticus sp.]